MMSVFYFLVFPGFLFAAFVGGFGWWLERKLSARFQYRVGPPWYQSYFDVLKLFAKETVMPDTASGPLYFAAPMVSFASSLLFTVMVAQSFFLGKSFIGDILVLFYLLIVPSLCVVLGGLASGNALALTGATRETKLMLAYEAVFITCILIAVIKAGGSVMASDIAGGQMFGGVYVKSISGIIAFVLSLLYIQAKLGIVPFDIPEAEQEIMAGPMVEYSGALYGLFRLSKMLLYFSVPLFIIFLFWNGALWTYVLKYILIILLVSVIKNTNPRLRIKDALFFFWFILFPLGLIGVFLAMKGL